MPDIAPGGLVRLAVETLTDPRGVAARLMALHLPRAALWQMLVLVVVLSVILAQLTTFLAPLPMGMEMMMGGPLAMGLLQIVLTITLVFGTHHIGRAFGGQGRFDQAMVLVVWLQAVMILLQVLQTLLLLTVPPLASILGLAGLVIFIWIFINFVAELHGFQSLGLVLLGALASLFGAIFGLSLVLTLIGVSAPGM